MSEYMFGVTRQKLTRREVQRRDRICRAEGGYGYSQIDESYGTSAGGRWLGWFSGPNRGEPFDRILAMRVLSQTQAARRCTNSPSCATTGCADCERSYGPPRR